MNYEKLSNKYEIGNFLKNLWVPSWVLLIISVGFE